MKKNKRNKYAEENAKLAINFFLFNNPKDIEKIKKIKVQTVAPWKRALSIVYGVGILLLSSFLLKNQESITFKIFGIFGLIISGYVFIVGVFGKKKTIDEVLLGVTDSILTAL